MALKLAVIPFQSASTAISVVATGIAAESRLPVTGRILAKPWEKLDRLANETTDEPQHLPENGDFATVVEQFQ